MEREKARLSPPGFNWTGHEPLSLQEAAKKKAECLRRSAKTLRELAKRGMSRRKFLRAAEKLEAEAAALEQGG
jgi:hypothetical protein